ncbi:MAG: hemolysin III family protein [Bdellovibrionaceae bacterium]|nr:hemolysin III family protein [Pseudobdellovibrionaceae bacterium]
MPVKHPDHSIKTFLARTVSAQLHLVGCIAAVAGVVVLLHFASLKSDPTHWWACAIFGSTSILVFAASTVCHFMSDGFQISKELDRRLADLDQIAIFLFIAGTYTPVIVNLISAPWNRILLVLIWSIGIAGILYTLFCSKFAIWAQHRFVRTAIYVLMGWVLIVRIGEAFEHLTSRTAFFLIAGGLCYTAGAVVYAIKRPNPFGNIFGYHEIWHVMVLLGYAFHYLMILGFYA